MQADPERLARFFSEVTTEVGQIIVAEVDLPSVERLLASDREALGRLIRK